MGYPRRPAGSIRPEEPTLTDPVPEPTRPTARPPWLLLLGAAVGLLLATLGLLEERRDSGVLPDDVAALVGQRTIRLVDYQRVLAGVENDLRSPIDDDLRRHVLDRMIDEELLVQRALDLGLAAIDRRVRGELTAGLIDAVVSEADAQEPSDTEVSRHFEENVDFFTRPGRLRVQTLFFSTRGDTLPGARTADERASLARERLAALETEGEMEEVIAGIEAELADPQVSPVPDVLLPASKVRDYVGPRLLQAVQDLEVGGISAPIESSGGLYLARLLEREPAIVPALEEVRDLARQDLKRRRGDAALRDYLDGLRTETPLAINERALRSAPQ